MKLFVFLCLIASFISFVFSEETAVETVAEVVNNKVKEVEIPKIDLDRECEQKFGIKLLEKKLQESENKLKQCQKNDKGNQQKKNELKRLQDELNAEKEKSDILSKSGEEMTKLLDEAKEVSSKLGAELEYYKSNLHALIYEKAREAAGVIYTEFDARVTQAARSLYNKMLAASMVGKIVDQVHSYGEVAMSAAASIFENVSLRIIYAPVLNYFDIPNDVSCEELKDIVVANVVKYATEWKLLFDGFRSKSIEILKENKRMENIADEIFDLSFTALIMLGLLVVVNPMISLVLRVTWLVLKYFVLLPLYIIKGTFFVVTLGWGSWLKKGSKVAHSPPKQK